MPLGIDSTTKLANGVRMPLFGLGTYKATGPEEVMRAVTTALEVGYRAIDTASVYGNETDIGRAVAAAGVPREELFITTKVWNDEQGHEETLEALERSLERLGLDYVDLYLVHWPAPRLYAGTWSAMEAALRSGRVRAIGVSNFLVHHLRDLGAVASVPPMVDQVEMHPRLQRSDLARYCEAAGIVRTAWAPIMRGRVFDIPEIAAIGRRHGKDPAQVAIRWVLQHGVVAIPKSVYPERIRSNADVFDFELSAEEMSLIDGLDAGERIGPDPDTYAVDQTR